MKITTAILDQFHVLSPEEGLATIGNVFPGNPVFSTSFGAEDQVITHMIAAGKLPIHCFTLDTGRLFPETYSTWSATLEKYALKIETFYPAAQQLKDWVSSNGPNAFYESVEKRKACCQIRKVEPLKQALKDVSVWVTGIRSAQSSNRENMQIIEWDGGFEVVKYHPLLHWSDEDVSTYLRTHNIPYNPLHDKGFVSIGCAPCTRAIRSGDDFRAGRWWWEDNSKKECGLHVKGH